MPPAPPGGCVSTVQVPLDGLVGLLSKRLSKMYGDSIKVEFIDIFEENAKEIYPELWELIEKKEAAVPVTLVNGKVACSGSIDLAPVLGEINKILEERAGLL